MHCNYCIEINFAPLNCFAVYCFLMSIEPMKKEWTKLDDCASKIQAAFRGYCCRKLLLQLKAKREEYDSLIENLERQVMDHGL